MKFLALFAVGAVAANIGTPVVKRATLVERDAAAISSAISAISSALQSLQSKVTGFSGAGDVAGLQSASGDVLTAINSGDSAAKSSDQLSQADALNLVTPIQNLGSQVNTTVDALIGKKSALVSAGAGGTTLDQLTQQRDATSTFNTDLTAKIPTALQSTASSLAQPILDSLNQGIAAFQDQAGSGSGSGSASATGSASASGSASATAPASGSASASASAPASGSASATAVATGSGSGSLPTGTGAGSSPTGTGSGSSPSGTGSGSSPSGSAGATGASGATGTAGSSGSTASAASPSQSIAIAGAGHNAAIGFGAAAFAGLAAVVAL